MERLDEPIRDRHRRWPAVFDALQSVSGLVLAVFVLFHLLFDASILIGKDAMYAVSRFFEGEYVFGRPVPPLVSLLAGLVFAVFVVHALLALRKFPANARQYRTFLDHKAAMRHEDTSLWLVQVLTGFALFFLGSVHLYGVLTQPGDIGPFASADRVWSGRMWPLYLLLLPAVVVHAGIGVYRVALKWVPHLVSANRDSRTALRRARRWLIVCYLLLGYLALAAYMRIGIEHADQAGERYAPAAAVSPVSGIDGPPRRIP